MDLLFVQTPTYCYIGRRATSARRPIPIFWVVQATFGWYKLQLRVEFRMTRPAPQLCLSLCKGCTVAQELSVCLAGFAGGKNAHKTSLGVLGKN